MGELKEFCCNFCENCYDYGEDLKHSLCKDYNKYALPCQLEQIREKLENCLQAKQNLLKAQ